MAYPLRESDAIKRSPMLRQHLRNPAETGLGSYLARTYGWIPLSNETPTVPTTSFARVYSPREVVRDFREFELLRHTSGTSMRRRCP